MFLNVSKETTKIDESTRKSLLASYDNLLKMENKLNALLQKLGNKPVIEIQDYFPERQLNYLYVPHYEVVKLFNELSTKDDMGVCFEDDGGYLFFFFNVLEFASYEMICSQLEYHFDMIPDRMRNITLDLIAEKNGIEL
jgi:hypothetical protein